MTLTGPGGSGKTRLAMEAAASWSGVQGTACSGSVLATVRDPALVPQTIAQTLGAKDGLAEHIGDASCCSSSTTWSRSWTRRPACRRCRGVPEPTLLVTSRELLRVRGEVEYAVPPLADAEAVALFCERSQLRPPSRGIAELCRRLDNAAARASSSRLHARGC